MLTVGAALSYCYNTRMSFQKLAMSETLRHASTLLSCENSGAFVPKMRYLIRRCMYLFGVRWFFLGFEEKESPVTVLWNMHRDDFCVCMLKLKTNLYILNLFVDFLLVSMITRYFQVIVGVVLSLVWTCGAVNQVFEPGLERF